MRFLGLVDGRLSRAMAAIHKLAALGFTETDIPSLVGMYKERLPKSRAEAGRLEASDDAKQERRRVAEWAIRRMITLGFSEVEIGALAGLNPATLAHLLNPFEDRGVSLETALKLKELAQTVGAERLSLLLPQVQINVLDACHDKGRLVDASTNPEVAKALRILILNALILSSVPVPGVPGIHAFLAQIGDPENFVFLFGALPPAPRGAVAAADDQSAGDQVQRLKRLERLKAMEHEAEHLVQRFRDQRQRLERDLDGLSVTSIPKDGHIA